MKMMSRSALHFKKLEDLNFFYSRYLFRFNNLEKIYRVNSDYEKQQFINLVKPFHNKVNLCFDCFVKCIPSRYMRLSINDCRNQIILGKGFRIYKEFYDSVRRLEDETKSFKRRYKSENLDIGVKIFLDELIEVVEYIIKWIQHDKIVPTKIVDKNSKFIFPRMGTKKDIYERREWLEHYELHKVNYGKYPTYPEMVEERYLYNIKLEKYEKKKPYLPFFSRRSHTRYKKEWKDGTLLDH